jgi:hypothetical protein
VPLTSDLASGIVARLGSVHRVTALGNRLISDGGGSPAGVSESEPVPEGRARGMGYASAKSGSGQALCGEVVYRTAMAASKPPATFISDLRPSRMATFEATVALLEEIREIETRDGTRKKVRNGRLKDGTGEIVFVLWGSEVELVQEGDRVRITEGWVKDYQGRPQISLGRSGKLEKLPGSS